MESATSSAGAVLLPDSSERGCYLASLHYVAKFYMALSFLPMILIMVLDQIQLVIVFAICVGLVLFCLGFSRLCYNARVFATWPKHFDLFNLLLYSVGMPIAATQPQWMGHWLQVWVTGGTCLFMWVTIFFTKYNFVHDTMKDKVPREHWDKPIIFAFARAIALAWGIALLVMTAASLVVAIIPHEHGNDTLIDILCNYVFGIGPLVVAAVAQHIIIRRYTRRIHVMKAAGVAQAAADGPPAAPSAAYGEKGLTKGMGAASKAGESDTRKVADVKVVGEEQV